ncbi:MAG: hypothetical protein HY063_10905 [Bacteroidetes bacterium]|nr:hypothetical protein [Bacteroidota bacterium]
MTLLASLWGCSKDKGLPPDTLPFAWVKKDNQATYKYISSTDTTLNALTLSVIINPGNTNLRFKFSYPQWTSIPFSKSVGDDYNVYRERDGLNTSAYTSCGWVSLTTFQFMRAPLTPKLNDFYPDYLCEEKIYSAYNVLETNKTINVPLGTFTTYVLQDTLTLRKEYWDEKNGIIKFELFDTTGTLSGQYQLTSKNY